MPLRFRILAADPHAPQQEPAPSADRLIDVADGLDEIRFGRRAGLEVELPFPALSAVHARLFRDPDGGGWALEDLGSTNGTTVDGRRLSPGTPQPLSTGRTFRLAHIAVVFEGPSSGNRPAEGTGTIARRLVSDLFARRDAAEVPQIVVLTGPAAGRVLRLARADRPYSVGRAPTCDLPIDVDQMSREHAAFKRQWEGVFVQDLGSKNGISVDGTRVAGSRRLRDGDRVDIGTIGLRLDDPEDRYLRQMEQPEPATAATKLAPTLAPPARASTSSARLAIATAVVVLVAVAALVVALLLGS